MTDILFCGKIPLAIAAMDAELPPFNNGEHNPENASTLDRDIALLNLTRAQNLVFPRLLDLFMACSVRVKQWLSG